MRQLTLTVLKRYSTIHPGPNLRKATLCRRRHLVRLRQTSPGALIRNHAEAVSIASLERSRSGRVMSLVGSITNTQQCQETKPSCENCLIKELKCEYPSQANTKIVRRPSSASGPSRAVVRHDEPRLPATLSTPTSFNMDDMRCFHHFLTVAYPHLPLGNDSVWVQDIPIFAQQVRYSTTITTYYS